MASRWSVFQRGDGWALDLSIEQVIAFSRLALAAVALLAIYLDPTQPARYAQSAYVFLIAYLGFATLAVAASLLDPARTAWPLTTHVIDIAAGALLMHLTEGPTSPFFLFFTFILLSATLRWDWRGAVPTAGLLIAVLALIVFVDPVPLTAADDELNRVIMRGAYIFVLGLMLAFVGAYRRRSQDRFAKLAAWPASEQAGTDEPALHNVLAHAASVMNATKIVVGWEQEDEPYFNYCTWDDGRYNHARELVADAGLRLVADELARSTFMTTGGTSTKVLTSRGVAHLGAPALSADLRAKYALRRVATAPFAQVHFSGRVFASNCRRLGDGLLPLIEIVAFRVGIELEHHLLRQQSAAAQSASQRVRLAGQVHDGVLQSLTAASLHLKAIRRQADNRLSRELEAVTDIVAGEQARVRHLVDAMRPKRAPPTTFRLASDGQRLLAEIGRSWHCETPLKVTPAEATVSPELGEQLYLVLAETIANAVRHGQARRVAVEMHRNGHSLDLRMDDDGSGFQGLSGEYDQASLEALGIGPFSLCERVKTLGGNLKVVTGAGGAGVHIRLPL